jgi:hypothetical protein
MADVDGATYPFWANVNAHCFQAAMIGQHKPASIPAQ